MFGAFSKAIGQLSDPAMRRAVWAGMGVAIVVFAGLWTVIGYLLTNTALFEWGWLETVTDLLGGVATLVLTWLLFPGIISAVISLMLEGIAHAVEARHYPHLGQASGLPFSQSLVSSLRFLAVMIVLNMGMLVFLFLGPVFPFVFYGVNGYLLSREYFEMVAFRRVGPADARALRKAHQGPLLVAGVVIAFLLTVPLVNLLAPIIATAVMVHLFEAWRPHKGSV